jgi:hypothetical protein
MELRLVSEKIISGLSIQTDNATEMDPNKGKIDAWMEVGNKDS